MNELPRELYTQVTTEFRLTKPKFIMLSKMLREGKLQPNIQHMRVDFMIRFKRTTSDSIYEYSSSTKVGERIDVDVTFDESIESDISQITLTYNCTF